MNLLKQKFVEELNREEICTEDKDTIKKCFYELLKSTKSVSSDYIKSNR